MYIFVFLCFTSTIASKVLLDKPMQTFSIFTTGCVIPNYPPISENIRNLIGSPRETINCTKTFPIINSNRSHIWVEEEAFLYYSITEPAQFYCCYTNFSAKNNLDNMLYGECLQFSVIIEVKHEFVRVECFYLDYKIFEEYLVFPKIKQISHTKDSEKFNVLIFGLESVSRLNFLRTMPATAKFLQERGSVQLLGYNKLGDNSFPNLFPLLTGQSFPDVLKFCIRPNNINNNTAADPYRCRYIWEQFKTAGYVTALGSDSPAGLLGSYEYNFRQIPTDFYLQPLMYETRNMFKNKYYNYHICAKNKFYYKILLNYINDLTEILVENNLFGIFWEESISHEHLNYPKLMDLDYVKVLQDLDSNGYLNESVIIFLSDHGMRWGEIVLTEQGRLEERLPLMEVLFPPKFKNLYNLAYQNFKDNSRRLTTPYDVYYSLRDLLNPTLLKDQEVQKRSRSHAYSKTSLFLPVSERRTCAHTGISEHWCTCYKGKTLQAHHKVRKVAAGHMIKHINGLLNNSPQCQKLSVDNILDVSMTEDSRGSTFRVVIQASPGGGIFDGTLRRERGLWAISGTVSRLNLYRNQSSCVDNQMIEMYCYCK